MKTFFLFFASLVLSSILGQSQTVTDIDGNVYNTVTIGTQVWLKENLKVTHYRNGDALPNVVNSFTWAGLTNGAYCNYENDPGNVTDYGRLYNWYASNDPRGLAPDGWHVATDAEWTTLTDLLGGEDVAGGKLKEVGTAHWWNPNVGATDEVDFTALPGGYRANNEVFIGLQNIGSWWTSTESSPAEGWARGIFNEAINVDRGWYYEKKMGFSVRCVMDPSTGINERGLNREIHIFPNPASDRIRIIGLTEQGTEVRIFTLPGEYILQKTLSNSSDEIDVHALSEGLYIVEILAKGITVHRKLIKN